MESTAATTPPTQPAAQTAAVTGRSRQFWQGALIAAAAVPLIIGCWNAGFTTYDDSIHVFANKRLASSVTDLIMPAENSTYFPVTEFSYHIDRALFSNTLPRYLHTWAPGVRWMTLLYHIGAALVLWRVLRLMRVGESAAFFIALVFACHPLACETVCWISERKNALAALFGFASLWAWLRWDGRMLRMPLTVLFYLLALLSKPSALGLLPVFLFFEIFNVPAGLNGEGPIHIRPSKSWIGIFGRFAPLAAVAAASVVINLRGHAGTLQPPPGGSVFTAILTDLEILSRYLYNLAVPVQLSAAYFVDPVRSLGDPRVAGYGLLLLALAAVTTWLAPRRLYALLGWFWFFGALGPNLNLIALPHIMQDRYIYLSTPGMLLVLAETFSGLFQRMSSARFDAAAQRRVLRILCGAYVTMLIALSTARGAIWGTNYGIFKDAVEKQPQSTFAHFGLGDAYSQVWQMNEKRNPQLAGDYFRLYMEEWILALECPDALRYATYMNMGTTVGNDFRQRGDLKAAEKYWLIAATEPTETFDDLPVRAMALDSLAALRLLQRRPEDAFAFADAAVQLQYVDTTVLMRARTRLAIAEKNHDAGNEGEIGKHLDGARKDLQAIAPTSPVYPEAQKLSLHVLLSDPH